MDEVVNTDAAYNAGLKAGQTAAKLVNSGPLGPGMLGYLAIGYTVHYMAALSIKLLKK